MKGLSILLTMALLMGAAGCAAMDEDESRQLNSFLVDVYEDQQINNAIVAQHTLYPYHFEPNGQQLNQLGMHDLSVLAQHYSKNPGRLNVRRGNAGDELYRARVEVVDAMLASSGVPVDRIQIQDDMPGGDGLASEHVVLILRETRQRNISYSGDVRDEGAVEVRNGSSNMVQPTYGGQ